MSDLLALLIAFYMAALAAVATFDRSGMDLPLKGGDATLMQRRSDGGERYPMKLSYRQFVSYLFGYLAFIAIVLFLYVLFADKGWPRIIESVKDHSSIKNVSTGVVFVGGVFLFFQMLTTSLLGIYFLAERIQTLSD